MTLTYGKSSPWDILGKAERDLLRLENAEQAGDAQSASDALFDLAVTILSVKDWLKKHPSTAYAPSTVESYADASRAFQFMRDLANAGKHREITR